jgi:hypothetical protein
VGLSGFGVAYDSGVFGTPDGHDHSAVISVSANTGSTVAVADRVILDSVLGEQIATPPRVPFKIVWWTPSS